MATIFMVKDLHCKFCVSSENTLKEYDGLFVSNELCLMRYLDFINLNNISIAVITLKC